MNTHDDDVLDSRLRDALQSEAETVQPVGDGLSRIRERIDARRSRVWWRSPAVAIAAAAVAGLVAGGVVLGTLVGDGDKDSTLPAQTTQEVTTPEPTPSASDLPTTTRTTPPPSSAPEVSRTNTAPAPPAADTQVFVYYLHDDGRSPRLYREQHTTPLVGGNKVVTAVSELFGDQAVDPDYSSPWPAGTRVLDYDRSGDTATIDLSAFPSVGSGVEQATVQQLVYTVTANDQAVKRVRLLVDGRTPEGHSDLAEPQARAAQLDVQGLIWILAPTQGATSGSPVLVTVYGTAYEGNVVLKVFRGSTEVASDFVTTAMGEFREASTRFTLPAGSYTVRAYDENAEDGSLVERDSKAFTVR